MKEKHYSKVKAAGMKSAFVNNGTVTMTSFGKGNKAILEKEINNGIITDLQVTNQFDVAFIGAKKFDINSKRVKNALSDNPVKDNEQDVGLDLLHAKKQLEERYFSKTFPGENIHIQIAYNILDIKKILSIYANNVVFALNNLRRLNELGRENDFIGYLYTGNKYDDLMKNCNLCKDKECIVKRKKNQKSSSSVYIPFCKSTKKFHYYYKSAKEYAPYYREFFYSGEFIKKDGKYEEKLRSYKDTYNILRLISCLRQSCFHDQISTTGFLFNPIKDVELKELVDRLYEAKTESAHKNFFSNNGKNMSFLFDIYKAKTDEERKKLAREYYGFVVYKQDKNLGFSIKKLRENMLENQKLVYIKNDHQYDSVRTKLYSLLDFVLYKHYNNTKLQDEIVESLRCAYTEEDKQIVYSKQAESSVLALGDVINNQLIPKMNGDVIKTQRKAFIDRNWFEDIKLSKTASDFSKIIYVLTLFLDGKEINELLSALINKLENIASFIDVMKDMGIAADFNKDYAVLGNSYKIANELRSMKSFVRMQNDIPKFSKGTYYDGASVLGIKKNSIHIENDIDEDYLDGFFVEGNDNNVRNFIINNVLKSKRFLYLVRYNNPKRSRALASNQEVIKFVLNGIPETQINRYYNSVTGFDSSKVSFEEKVNELSKRISNINFEQFVGVKQTAAENIEKEQMKAIIGLYLTVLYLLTKNLVKINARYTIAISNLEKDTQLHNLPFWQDNPFAISDLFVKNKWVKDDWYKNGDKHTLSDYKKNAQKEVFRVYRNSIAHMTVITDAYKYLSDNSSLKITKIKSYYQIYHSIMQRVIVNQLKHDKINLNDFAQKSYDNAIKYGSYTKEWVKVLNYPFAYNLARYKNLINEKIFEADRS